MTRIITIFLLTLSLINLSKAEDINVGYFAGGCFWCMEESFEKVDGVIDVVSGYSGGITKNPTYKDVIKGNTGHFETIKVIYDNDLINYDDLLKIYWKNVDPFDSNGQFCDKGYAYKSVIFYETKNEKNFIDISIKRLEKKFKKKDSYFY